MPLTGQLKIQTPNPFYATSGLFLPDALPNDLMGAWFFGKAAGETNAQAAARCSFNRAPGASNLAADRQWPGGVPTFANNYARFENSRLLQTRVADWGIAGGCAFMLCRTMDTTVGFASNDRGFVVGTYGGNTNKGHGFEFADVSSSAARAIDYDTSGVLTNQVDMGEVTTDLQKWRVYFYSTGPTSLQALNINPGDGTTPAPNATPFVGGRVAGSQKVTIGGRVADSAGYTPTIHKDICVVLLFDAIPGLSDRATIAAQLARVALRPTTAVIIGA